MEFLDYVTRNLDRIVSELLRHIHIIAIAVPISIGIGAPIGIAIANHKNLAKVVIYIASVMMTIPSLALFGVMVVLLAPFGAGLGIPPAVIALVVYSMLPIIRNVVVAIRAVDPEMIEAARGMGMTKAQVLFKVRLPLSVPIIMAGIRNAAVMGIAVTTIAYLVGARGLGYFIFSGLSRARLDMILVGAILVSAMGIGTNYGLMKLEQFLTPRGVRLERQENR
ncbi:MAG TPA: choline ABC transporter permease [Kosmotogaceae bacterium]|nr:MAG: ABC-type proline/glycine betaine transport system, permease component [Thermotogales bacterium 46_20]HAA86389.1 choline ABC transporter permease [Kosmotogaceae bacterium]